MGWYDAIKDAVAAADRLKDSELLQRLAEVRMEGAKLAEENARLREENLALKAHLRTQSELVFRRNVYWREPADGAAEGPFCPKCWDGEGKLARMQEQAGDSWWRCLVCERAVRCSGGSGSGPGSDPSRGGSWMAS